MSEMPQAVPSQYAPTSVAGIPQAPKAPELPPEPPVSEGPPTFRPFRRSDTIGTLAGALAKAQGSMLAATKDATNPHFKSRFASLASVWNACREALSSNGLAVYQAPSCTGRRVTVVTLLMHASGEWIESSLTMLAMQDTPQGIGGTVTYARRYALSGVGVAPEDDDGEEASRTLPQGIRQDAGARSPLQQPIEKSPVGGGPAEAPAPTSPVGSQQPQSGPPPPRPLRPGPSAAPTARAMPPPPGMKPPARAPGS